MVTFYKYCGVVIHCSLSWEPFLANLKDKSRTRSGELVRWARANGVSADVRVRLWTVYVETGAAWGLGLVMLSKSQATALLRIQRGCGRLLLGYSRRSVVPAVCFDLGWKLWSTHAL